MTASDPKNVEFVEPGARRRHAHLQRVAETLLVLHKSLLDEARAEHEAEHGPIGSAAAFLQLLMGDPAFHWMRQLSSPMAQLDELLELPTPPSYEQARAVRARFEYLVASEEDHDFAVRYRALLQRSPTLILSHADVRFALRAL